MIRMLPAILLLLALLLPRPPSAVAAGQAPGVVGQLGGPLSAVAATGQAVYVATGRRLFALGVADPAHPAPLGPGLFLPAAVRGVAVAGSLAYVADGNAGLRILDLSSPGRPVERGVLPGPTTGVAVAGALAFVLGATELRVVDVSDPAQPKLTGAFPVQGQPSAVAVVGGVVYLGVQPIPMAQGAAGAGLFVLDVRDPAHPTQLVRFPGAVEQLLAAGDHLYYSAPDQRTGQPVVHVLGVADPRSPREVAALPGVPGFTAAEGARLFAVDGAGLQLFDASNPAQPRPLGAFQVPGQFRGVAGAVVAGAYAYAWAGDNALHVVSLADPRHPVEVGVYHGGPSHANGVAVAGRYAYVANGFDTALDVLDVGDPAQPVQVGAVNLGGSVQSVAVQGADAYAALITGSLVIVDVSDPTRPRPVGSFGAPPTAAGLRAELGTIAVAGRYAYLPTSAGLLIVDVADPARPVAVGRYPGALASYVLAVADGRAYVAADRQLLTLDVADPARPTLLATTTLPANPLDVAVDGRYLYATDRSGFVVLAAADPAHPTEVASVQTAANGEGLGNIAVSDNLLWLSGAGGVALYDVRDPAHPASLGSLDLDDDSPAVVRAAGDTAYVASLFGGLYLLRPGAGGATSAPPHDNRYFAQTGFRIDNDTIWDYFNRRGGVPTFGYPTSRTILFLGHPSQFFQRDVLQVFPDGAVHPLNLLGASGGAAGASNGHSGILPFTSFDFSTFPAADPTLAARAPNAFTSPDYAAAVIAFVRATAPDVWNGLPVHFYQTFVGMVTLADAYPNGGGNPALLPLLNLEIWGVPISAPAFDPNNRHFVYQRFQRGIMHYDATCDCTQGILMGDYLKAIITGQGLPVDLAQEAADSPFLRLYAPGRPGWLSDPNLLPATDLTDAFVPE